MREIFVGEFPGSRSVEKAEKISQKQAGYLAGHPQAVNSFKNFFALNNKKPLFFHHPKPVSNCQ